MQRAVILFGFILWLCAPGRSLADSTSAWHVGFLIDTYYSYDLNRPIQYANGFNQRGPGVRPFAVSSAEHNKFAINLGILDATYRTDNIRARVALQAGTYVDANYATESRPLRYFHVAMGGVRITDGLWLEAGIMPSHIGLETAVSSENINYTRSLMAEYSPYYETGARLTWDVNDQLSIAALVLNGWQIIDETNSDKAFGTQLIFKPSAEWVFNWSTFLGNERPDTELAAWRVFNDLYATYTTPSLTLAASLDCGVANTPDVVSVWYAATVQGKVPLSDVVALNARVETFTDFKGEIVTEVPGGRFSVIGGSVGVDVAPHPHATIRLEARHLRARDPIFLKGSAYVSSDTFFTSAVVVRIP